MQTIELVNCLGIVDALRNLRIEAHWETESIEDLIYICECTGVDISKIDFLRGCATVFQDDAETLDSYLNTAEKLIRREFSRIPKIDLSDPKLLRFVFLLSMAYKNPKIHEFIEALCAPALVLHTIDVVDHARTTPAGEFLYLLVGAELAQLRSELIQTENNGALH